MAERGDESISIQMRVKNHESTGDHAKRKKENRCPSLCSLSSVTVIETCGLSEE